MDRDRAGLSPAPPLPVAFVAALAALPVGVLLLFYAWPTLNLFVTTLDTAAVGDTVARSSTWSIAWFTLWQAVLSTLATLICGLPAAYVVARYQFPGRSWLIGVLTAVFVLPTVVVGAALLAVLPDAFDRTTGAVVAAHVVFNLAVIVRTVAPAWERLGPDLEAAAATLGATRRQQIFHIAVPVLRPPIVAAGIIVFLFSFTSYGVIRVLGAPGTRTVEVEVWRRATQLGDIEGAGVLAVAQLVVLASVAIAANRWQRRSTVAYTPSLLPPRPAKSSTERWFVGSIAGLTAFVVLAPLGALALSSVRTPQGWTTAGWTRLGDTEVRPGLRVSVDPVGALTRSLTTALWATLLAVLVGGLAALAIAASSRLGRVLDAGLMLPLGTSAVTIGFGMLITFDTAPVDWRASGWLVPFGHALIAVPFVVRVTVGVLRSVEPQLLAAAATLGASPIRAWANVLLPNLWRPLGAAGALAAAISLGEFGATTVLSRTGQETLPVTIERLLGRTGTLFQAQAAVLATILAVATIVLVVIAERGGALGRTVGASATAQGDLASRPASVEPISSDHNEHRHSSAGRR